MPRRLAVALLLLPAGPLGAQPAVDPGEQAVIDANRAIGAHNDKIAADNAAAQAAYRAEVARVEAQRRANDAGFAAATAAFEAKQAQYDADMARWRAESARVAAQSRAPGKPPATKTVSADKPPLAGGVICQRITTTGTLVPGRRTCMTQREWDRFNAGQ